MSERVESVKQPSPTVKHRSTLVRRVSGMFKDGKSSGPPLLFRHASMQRLRHCCQNLNLFPYLLYSFGNSKSHPTVQKMYCQFVMLMHNFSVIVQSILQKMLQVTPVKNSVRFAVSFQQVLLKKLDTKSLARSYEALVTLRKISKSAQTATIDVKDEIKFAKFKPQGRKRISLVLTLAVYFALLVLASQLVGIFSVMLFGTYPPGFIFLVSALLFLGYITLKIMAYDKAGHGFKEEKRKTDFHGIAPPAGIAARACIKGSCVKGHKNSERNTVTRSYSPAEMTPGYSPGGGVPDVLMNNSATEGMYEAQKG